MWRAFGLIPLWAVLAAVLMAPCGQAAESAAEDPLAAMALEARDAYTPITDEAAAARKQTLLDAMAELEDELGDEAWVEEVDLASFLRWDELTEQVQADEPNIRLLQEIRTLYYKPRVGLELPEVDGVRDALTRYADALYVRSRPEFAKSYRTNLDRLAEQLRRLAASPTTEDAMAVGRTLEYLERAGQASDLVAAVRERYQQPNLYAEVSQRVLAGGFASDVRQVEGVRENILGTSIRGTATMRGQVDLQLVPSSELATFDIRLTGQITSNNVGYNGPVKIYTNGYTRVWAKKRVFLDVDGLSSLGAVADCSTSSRIRSIAARCACVRRIAWKRARGSKGRAERIASARAEGRVARSFNRQTAELVDEANGRYDDEFRKRLARRDGMPNRLRFRTTEKQLCVEALRAGPAQLAHAGDPPEISDEHDMSLRVHDSLVGNLGETLIGGETLTDESLLELLQEAGAEVPDELKIGPESDPWSITFYRQQPLSVAFGDDEVTVGLQGNRFTRGDQVISDLIRISAVYQLLHEGGEIKLLRKGDVAVDFVNQERLSVQKVAMKTFLRRKFDALFKPEVASRDLQLPGRWERAGGLVLKQLEAANGWLTLGWYLPEEGEADVEQLARAAQ